MLSPLLTLYIVGLLICTLGFYKFIYFISIGYGLSIFGMGVALLLMFPSRLTVGSICLCSLLIIYGLRLSFFLYAREQVKSYNDKMKSEYKKDSNKLPLPIKGSLWVSTALIYVGEVSPVLFRIQNSTSKTKADDLNAWIGIAIAVFGIIVEAISDHQKSVSKKKDASRFCSTGLYRWVRCPNYFGEITFWIGIFVSGVNHFHGIWQWTTAIFGLTCILFTMYSSTRSIEARHARIYGADPEFQEYSKKTPILIPFIPLYSLGGVKNGVPQNSDSKKEYFRK